MEESMRSSSRKSTAAEGTAISREQADMSEENSIESCNRIAPETVAEGEQYQTKPDESLLEAILKTFPGRRQDARTYSPLALAYIGDAIYDLIIRTVVVERANRPANKLHHITVQYVKASAQALIVQTLMEELTEEEQAVYRRGHNSKPHTMAKNASAGDYLKATGFEAVLGYLYLNGRMDRVLELVKRGIELTGFAL